MLPQVLQAPPDPAHLRQLMHFLAVARAGGFRRAAATAGVQQPTLSKSVAELEARLGAALLVRARGGLTLTDAGARLVERCEAIEDLVRAPLQDAPTALTGELRLATHEHVAVHLLPAFVLALAERHPRLQVRITTGPAAHLLPDLESGALDLALFFTWPERPAFTRRTLGRYPCHLVVGAAHAHDVRVARRLIGSREIDDAGGRDFPTLARLQARDPATTIALSCNSLEAQKRLVLAGAGVAILPELVVAAELASGALVRVDPHWVYEARLDLVRVLGRRPTAPVKAALAVLEQTLGAG